MKVLLINPPRSPHNGILEHASEEALPFIHRKLIGPPLGLLTVAAAIDDLCDVVILESKAEYDLNPDAPPFKQLVKQYLSEHQPDIAGVTTIASEHNGAMEALEVVREFSPDILTVAGGLHVTLCPSDYENSLVDVVLPGQSALVFRDVVTAAMAKKSLDSVPGIGLNRPDGLHFTKALDEPIDGAQKHFVPPNRSYLKKWISTYIVGASVHPATYVFTSLGCPYKCSFCSIWPQFGGKYYKRDIESIISELKTLDDYPVVRFADANTLFEKQFLDKLFDRIIEEDIKKFFIMDLRTDAVAANPKLIEKLAKGGLKVVISGFESFRNEELKSYNKSTKAETIHEAVEIMHSSGIMIRGNYVVPPDYSNDDLDALAEYASSHRVAYAGYTVLTPMPGTILYDEMKDQIIEPNLDKYNFFNAVLKTRLPLDDFYRRVADLWVIKKGKDVI